MTLYDLKYLDSDRAWTPFSGRCTGALAKAQALLCLMVSEQDALRPFGGGLHAVIGMSNAEEDALLQVVSVAASGAADYLNNADASYDLNVNIDNVTATDIGMSILMTVTYRAQSTQISAVIQE